MDRRTTRAAASPARWLLLGGLAIFALLIAWVAFTWVTEDGETAGMALAVYGVPPLLLGYLLLLAGAILGVPGLLLARDASIGDRLVWLAGAGVVLALTSVFVAHEASAPPKLDTQDRQLVLEASLRTLAAGRLDTNQVAGDPVFPTPPVILRTAPGFRDSRVHGQWVQRMVAAGVLAGMCAAPDLTRCAGRAGATFVSVVDVSLLGDYVSVQLDVAAPGEGGCQSVADSATVSAFRLRVVRNEPGWEVRRVVTVAWGRRGCRWL